MEANLRLSPGALQTGWPASFRLPRQFAAIGANQFTYRHVFPSLSNNSLLPVPYILW